MAYPATQPAAITTGTTISKSTFGDPVLAALNFLANRPHVSVRRDAAQTTPSGTEASVSWDVEEEDTDSMWTSGTPTRITFNTAGVYVVTYTLGITSHATGFRLLSLLLNGSAAIGVETRPAVNGDNTFISLSRQYKFAATNYIEGRFNQNSGTTIGVTAGGGHKWTSLSATWVGNG